MKELRRYESFVSISEMDTFICEALEVLELCEFNIKLIRLLAGHSCKVMGVSLPNTNYTLILTFE